MSKESTELTNKVFTSLSKISKESLLVNVNGKDYKVLLDGYCTMIDGKVCNCLLNTRCTSNCNFCSKHQKNFQNDNPNNIDENLNTEKSAHAVPILHLKIKAMEYLLDIAYKKDHHKDKELNKETKKNIQAQLKKELNIFVDIPKPG